MSSAGIVYIDGDEQGQYEGLEVRSNWTVHLAQHAGLSAAFRWALAAFPYEASYGWLADDMVPRTIGFDRMLETAAGRCCMSQCRDEWVYPQFPDHVRDGREPSAGQCWGGDLIRSVGWWALPGTFQGGTDVAWSNIVHALGRMRFVEEATVEHRHWRLGKRPKDALDTDMLDSNGHAHTQRDIELLYRWLGSPDFRRTVRRVKASCRP